MQRRGRWWVFRGAVGGLLVVGLSGAPVVLSAAAASAASAGLTQPRATQTGDGPSEPAPSLAVQTGPAQIGPAQVNALGRPDLCWQAGGNGALVALARCDSALQAQRWALTSNGVLMNGTGYCLEAAPGGLFIDFADQCGGSPAQRWQFSGVTGTLTSAGTGGCAVAGGALTPGTAVVGGTCTTAAADRRWSLGYSAVTVSAGPAHGPAGGTFTAAVTVTDGASAQAAYGATVRLGVPRGLAVTALRGTGAAAGWRCYVSALTCSGNLPAGVAGRIEIAGRMPAAAQPGTGYRLAAGVSVGGTSQQAGVAPTTASVPVTVVAGAPAGSGDTAGSGGAAASPAVGGPGRGGTARTGVRVGGLLAGILLLGGGLLVAVARRRPPGGPGAGAHDHGPGGPGARAGDRGAVARPAERAVPDAKLTDTQPFVWID